jgi:hypothetical protein
MNPLIITLHQIPPASVNNEGESRVSLLCQEVADGDNGRAHFNKVCF